MTLTSNHIYNLPPSQNSSQEPKGYLGLEDWSEQRSAQENPETNPMPTIPRTKKKAKAGPSAPTQSQPSTSQKPTPAPPSATASSPLKRASPGKGRSTPRQGKKSRSTRSQAAPAASHSSDDDFTPEARWTRGGTRSRPGSAVKHGYVVKIHNITQLAFVHGPSNICAH